MPLMPDQILGCYRIVRHLQSGGMGEIYEVFNTQLERSEAMKVLPAELAEQPDFVNRFVSEARKNARLDHPHIVPVYQISAPDARPVYFTMKLIHGETLKHWYKGRLPMGEREACELMLQICEALIYAHEQGLIHRDLKPANLMFDRKGRLYLMDFGIARAAQDTHLTQTGTQMGTAAYMSPEQAQDAKNVDARTDLYSLGVMLFEMLTGRTPFLSDSQVKMALKHIQEPIPDPAELNPGLSPGMVSLIRVLLEKNPEDRLPDAASLRDRLEAILAGEAIIQAPAYPRAVSLPSGETAILPPAGEHSLTMPAPPELAPSSDSTLPLGPVVSEASDGTLVMPEAGTATETTAPSGQAGEAPSQPPQTSTSKPPQAPEPAPPSQSEPASEPLITGVSALIDKQAAKRRNRKRLAIAAGLLVIGLGIWGNLEEPDSCCPAEDSVFGTDFGPGYVPNDGSDPNDAAQGDVASLAEALADKYLNQADSKGQSLNQSVDAAERLADQAAAKAFEAPVGQYAFTASRAVTSQDLYGISCDGLEIMRNEIFARHGRAFSDDYLRSHFESQPWYQVNHSFNEGLLNPIEQYNAGYILDQEKSGGCY